MKIGQYGTYLPVKNNWAWSNLTNVVWVEQPAGTGFSTLKSPAPQNEIEVAAQFLGFWKNFVDTFQLHNKKVYIAGESYAGYYVPYIADAMHNATGTSPEYHKTPHQNLSETPPMTCIEASTNFSCSRNRRDLL